jgi:uncharacterized protein YeaO (DUF488 family)
MLQLYLRVPSLLMFADQRAMTKPTVNVKRVYEPPSRDDGIRVLVDRLWPRGLSKPHAAVDLWLKDLAPSVRLRRWFNHDPARWTEFKHRYAQELDAKKTAVAALLGATRRGRVTLVFGARDREHNNAVALHSYLTSHTA